MTLLPKTTDHHEKNNSVNSSKRSFFCRVFISHRIPQNVGDRVKSICPDGPVVVGSYAYLDGELHVRLSLAMDAIVNGLIESRPDIIVRIQLIRHMEGQANTWQLDVRSQLPSLSPYVVLLPICTIIIQSWCHDWRTVVCCACSGRI